MQEMGMRGKICFAASSGGHMEEMSRLKPLVQEQDFFLTEKSDYTVVDWCPRVYFVKQINRSEITFIFKFLILCFQSCRILLRERPFAVVSTGALAAFPICMFAKLSGKKVIYIESFARVDQGSLTGKLMYRFADLFIVQWEDLLRVYPKAVYGGSIF